MIHLWHSRPYTQKTISYQRNTGSSTLIAALFTLAKDGKQSKCDIFTQKNIIWVLRKTEIIGKLMYLEEIILNEVSQSQKGKKKDAFFHLWMLALII